MHAPVVKGDNKHSLNFLGGGGMEFNKNTHLSNAWQWLLGKICSCQNFFQNDLNALERKVLGHYFLTYCLQPSYEGKPHIHRGVSPPEGQSYSHPKLCNIAVDP